MIDMIRDGVPEPDLRSRGDKAIFNALVRTASSALQRSWTRAEWEGVILEPRSRLGVQVRLKAGKTTRTPKAVHDLLDGAWKKAMAWLAKADPPITRETAIARARLVRDACGDPDLNLNDVDRTVLRHAAEVGMKRGTDRVALPRRQVMDATGLAERTVRTSLARLSDLGLLKQVARGRPGGPATKRRQAALYRLPTQTQLDQTYQYRETRSVGPLALVCGTPDQTTDGTGSQICGTPAVEQTSTMGPNMLSLTITVDNADELKAALSALTQAGVDISGQHPAANVLPFRPNRGDGVAGGA